MPIAGGSRAPRRFGPRCKYGAAAAMPPFWFALRVWVEWALLEKIGHTGGTAYAFQIDNLSTGFQLPDQNISSNPSGPA